MVRLCLAVMIPEADSVSTKATEPQHNIASASHFFFELHISQARANEEDKAAKPESRFFQRSLS